MKKKNNTTVKISKLMIIGVILLFCLIIGKLSVVALKKTIDGVDLSVKAAERKTAKEILYAKRGTIYDIKGEILAQNVNSYTVIAILSESRTTDPKKPEHVVDKKMTAEALAPLINMEVDYLLGLLDKDLYQVELGPGGRGITELTKNAIAKLDLPGIEFISSTKRYYKMGNFASYLIGYAKKNDSGEIEGEMGIEEYFNDTLKGTNGDREYQKDAYGYQIPNTPTIVNDPTSGSDIYLTIDNNIQLLVENAIAELKKDASFDWMSVTIANAKTGAILASGSTPNFNLNTLDNIDSYLNPLVSYQYEPGSTMKIFSFMAAIENGEYDGDKTYHSGALTIGKNVVRDFNKKGWGTITFDQGFSYSSNVAASLLGQKLGRQNLRDFYNKLGFGQKTGIDLPGEQAGKINFVYDIELANASFGQGITTTPIQNIQALTTLANDGMMIKPYIIDKIVDSKGNISYKGEREEITQVASKETIDKMRSLMYDVVHSGLTDAKYYKTANVKIIGKTGTAEIADSKGGYLTGPYDMIRSFAGLFPYENPQYIIYFSIKRYTGAYKTMANKIAAIVDAVAKKDDDINENVSHLDETKIVKLNNYISSSVEKTENDLKEVGLVPVVLGDGDIIVNQYPLKNVTVTNGTRVFLLTNKKDYIMPNVIGWSSNEIITFCKMIGLKYTINHFGSVASTSIEKGTKINLEEILTINLE